MLLAIQNPVLPLYKFAKIVLETNVPQQVAQRREQ